MEYEVGIAAVEI